METGCGYWGRRPVDCLGSLAFVSALNLIETYGCCGISLFVCLFVVSRRYIAQCKTKSVGFLTSCKNNSRRVSINLSVESQQDTPTCPVICCGVTYSDVRHFVSVNCEFGVTFTNLRHRNVASNVVTAYGRLVTWTGADPLQEACLCEYHVTQ